MNYFLNTFDTYLFILDKIHDQKLIFHPLCSTGENEQYQLEIPFMSGQLTALLTIKNGRLTDLEVLDSELQEPFLPFFMSAANGPYILEARGELSAILFDLKKKCCIQKPFESRQLDLLLDHAKDAWKEELDFPFEDLSTTAVLREKDSKKWYALFARIPLFKLDSHADSSLTVSIMNFKAPVNPEDFNDVDLYDGWHMNHQHWKTLVLDHGIEDQKVLELLKQSRSQLCPEASWVVPANPAYYDLHSLFLEGSECTWKQNGKQKVGDLVYIYAGMPMGYLMYKTRVLETDIHEPYQDSNLHMEKVMKLKLLEEYPPSLYDRTFLKEHGLKSIRSARHLPPELEKVLASNSQSSSS